MSRITFFLLVLLAIPTGILAQPNITIVSGKKDTVSSAQHFITGLTDPESVLTVNDQPFPVYHTGAFAAEVKLSEGNNSIKIVSRKGKSVAEETFSTYYKPVAKPQSTSSLTIEEGSLLPEGISMVSPGEVVKVRIKSLPGSEVSWLNGIKLYELPVEQTLGIKGVYQGQYLVRENDSLLTSPIEVVVANSGSSVSKKLSEGLIVSKLDEPLLVQTLQDDAYLNYGLGQVRLGGAKIGSLASGIRLHAVAKVNELYKVRLSKSFEAWIPERQVEALPKGTFKPESLTSSWRLYGDEKYDYLHIGLAEKLPYTSYQEVNPARIVVNIFGAVSNTVWITQLQSAKEVKNVTYEQVESDIFRVVIELNHDQHWGYSIYYQGNSLAIRVKQQPKLQLQGMLIALDAGHGGSSLGAVGTTGLREKDVNLAMVFMLKSELEKCGAKVILTRSEDIDISMDDRLAFLKKNEPDLLISIHGNAGGSPFTAKGTSTYYKHIGYKDLSVAILDELLTINGVSNFGNIGSFNFALCSPTEFPCVLVETLFLSAPADEAMLIKKEFQQAMVKKIVNGVRKYLKDSK